MRLQVASLASPSTTPPPPTAEAPWLEFRGRLRAFVARRIENPADVDDVVQWVFLKLHRSLDRITRIDRIHAWLYRTARRAIADYYRSGARRYEVARGGVFELDSLAAPSRPEPPDEGPEVAACLTPMLDRLSPSDREAIVLTELAGHRVTDLAAVAALSISGAKSRVQRARRRLRRMLLECCHVALDARGMPVSCSKRDHSPSPLCSGGANA